MKLYLPVRQKASEIRPLPGFEEQLDQSCEACELWLPNPLQHLQTLVTTTKSLENHSILHPVERWSSGNKSGCTLCGFVVTTLQVLNRDHAFLHVDQICVVASPRRPDFPYQIKMVGLRSTISSPPADPQKLWEVELYSGQTTQNPLQHLPYRRSLASDSRSPKCLNLVRDWIRTCKTSHDNRDCHVLGDRDFPTRILDISLEDPKLVETTGQAGEFVALSHCWGRLTSSSSPPLTLTSNLQAHCTSGIPQNSLTATFRDAITVTRHLGYRYLWIDSLCIVQDDPADWERESGLMEAVYGNADLVIGATRAPDGLCGFLGPRLDYFEGETQLASSKTQSREASWTVSYRPALPHNRWVDNKEAFRPADEGPLESRAWAYQERILARRFVSFGQHEICWECTSILDCECFTTQGCPIDRGDPGLRTQVLPPRKYNLRRKLEQDIPDPLLRHAWRSNVVEPYSMRELTKPADRLVALSAIAFKWSEKLAEQYLAGIWKGDLRWYGLHWHCVKTRKGFVPDMPSWSWASVLGEVYHVRKRKLDRAHSPEIVEIDYVSPPENPCSRPRRASITFRGMVMEGVSIVRESNTKYSIKLPAGEVARFDVDGDLEPTDYLLKDGTITVSARRVQLSPAPVVDTGQFCVYSGLSCLLLASHVALVLGLSASEPRKYERLGLCVLTRGDIKSKCWKQQVITIV
ncbi:heterokaryon incompatibility protein-domain-containing protein [Dactylonectria macrodidyma]|uniref:Heterokaryon incompatibility protein-domain-containing protein n=1 Tax=Dactylonectria macrodidyma TaxID=307937 RepID=A0A9P9JNJ8_9HYPO|nr:heterokaryon incompatibility protein-domain-containing protein [Dactylonectria macrodidyma]